MRLALFCAAALLALPACSSTEPAATPPAAAGLGYAASNQSVDATFAALTTALDGLGPVSIVARVDHAANARSVGLTLMPTREVFFGNPVLGTPLMQRNQTAGLDLPQHILVYEGPEGSVYAAYNTADYLAARHGLAGVSSLPQIATALAGLTAGATNGTVAKTRAASVEAGEGLISVQSAFSVDETFRRLRDAVESAGPLSVVFALDHAANAQSVGLELRPTRLLVFGNPRLGTPLMAAERTVALDLPQRVLVYEDAGGTVRLVYNDPAYLAERHGITGQDATLQTIAGALAGLAATATRDG